LELLKSRGVGGSSKMAFLTNPYTVALGVPLFLLVSGTLAKKLARGPGWLRTDFFLGVQLTMAAISSALINMFELAKQLSSGSSSAHASAGLTATAVFLAMTLFSLLVVMSLHQDWEDNAVDGRILRLGVICNMIGGGLLASFILLVRGV
jgi:hypothetical protein